MKILLTGANGLLATDVANRLSKLKLEFRAVDKEDFDITDERAVFEYIELFKPNIVIHCAAYTAVDKAEDEADLCMCVNFSGSENIAKVCHKIGSEMLYISTDYVFHGDDCDTLLEVDSPKSPRSIYGKSKLFGEEAVLRHVGDKCYIVRISWVFGKHGNNFVKTMLKLAELKNELNVVDDQIGSPTFTEDLAVFLCDLIVSQKYGIYHATNEGYCSWAEFASDIMKLSGSSCKINPVDSSEYPTKAKRPKNSRLSKITLDQNGFSRLPHWKDALKRYLT
ncbi:MAG: dTDP-4-dehydrorhamnose reductase [Oscillospiraceae bacterium]|nr:dTDP-4-dehydrorhamnose reductase [Oscillospiraceae bacterium]